MIPGGAGSFHFFLFPLRILVYTILRRRKAGEKTRQERRLSDRNEKEDHILEVQVQLR
jgi:hypothetical protein